MAPRTRWQGSGAASGGHPAPAAAAPGLLILPDDLPESVLSSLSHEERLGGPALACRRLCKVASLPQLNESAQLHLDAEKAGGAARVLSFCRWLAARGAASVQTLDVRLWRIEAAADVAPALGAALSACDGGALRHARLSLPGDLLEGLSSWVAALRSLRVLELSCLRGGWDMARSLARLSQLEVLSLDSVSPARAALPPSLTRPLHLSNDGSWELAGQVGPGRGVSFGRGPPRRSGVLRATCAT